MLFEPLQVGRGVDPGQVLERGGYRRHDQQVGSQVQVVHTPHGRRHPGRLLHMAGALVVGGMEWLDDDQHGVDARR